MEFFLPSILFLLVACGIVFFVIPRFGPLVLAIASLVLLSLGIYNHYSMFESEYRLSSWQTGAAAYAPFLMIGALVLSIILYLFYLVPVSGSTNNLEAPSLPPSNTATNPITEGVNTMLRKGQELFGNGNGNKNGNAKGNASNSLFNVGNRPTNTPTNANRGSNNNGNTNKGSFFDAINPYAQNNRRRIN